AVGRIFAGGVDDDFGSRGRLVRVCNAGEVRNLSGERLFVQPFDVACSQDVDRALHVDFYEIRDAGANLLAHRAVGRDSGGDRDSAVAGQQLADEADTADVFVAVVFAEAQSLGKMRPDDVAVEHFHPGGAGSQALRHHG